MSCNNNIVVDVHWELVLYQVMLWVLYIWPTQSLQHPCEISSTAMPTLGNWGAAWLGWVGQSFGQRDLNQGDWAVLWPCFCWLHSLSLTKRHIIHCSTLWWDSSLFLLPWRPPRTSCFISTRWLLFLQKAFSNVSFFIHIAKGYV